MSDKPESSKTQLRKDFLSQLPEEIAYRVIGSLTPSDLMACAGVSRTWRRLCEDDRTWRRKCLENGYVKLDAPSFRFLGGWAAVRANEEAIFPHMELQEADQNQREREMPYGQLSNGMLTTGLQIQSGGIIARFDDGTLRVWNVDDAKPVFTLTGHTGRVLTFQVSDDGKYIISGSSDQTVRVWCGQTGVQRHVLRGLDNLVSGSGDQTLRVWDIVDGRCLHILVGHLKEVTCVQFGGERAVSGSNDSTVKVWNAHTGECLHTLTGHTKQMYSLLFEPERDLVVSNSFDGTIRLWDVRRGTCIAHLVGRQEEWFNQIQLRGNILVFCNSGSDVEFWDIRDGGSCTHRLQVANRDTSEITTWHRHTREITALQWLDSGLLETASHDGSVKLWDVDKGTFVRDLFRLPPGNRVCGLKATETLLVWAFDSKDEVDLILMDFDASYP